MNSNKIWSFLRQWLARLEEFVTHYIYTIPMVLGVIALATAGYLSYTAAKALDDLNDVIKSIPAVIEVEMAKTRAAIHEEARTTRKQHDSTVEEVMENRKTLELDHLQLKKQLNSIENKVDKVPSKPIVLGPVPPAPPVDSKRKKILGIF